MLKILIQEWMQHHSRSSFTILRTVLAKIVAKILGTFCLTILIKILCKTTTFAHDLVTDDHLESKKGAWSRCSGTILVTILWLSRPFWLKMVSVTILIEKWSSLFAIFKYNFVWPRSLLEIVDQDLEWPTIFGDDHVASFTFANTGSPTTVSLDASQLNTITTIYSGINGKGIGFPAPG